MTVEEIIESYRDVPRVEAVQTLEHLESCMFRHGLDLNEIDMQSPMRPGFVSLLNISRKGCAKWTALQRPIFGTTYSITKF